VNPTAWKHLEALGQSHSDSKRFDEATAIPSAWSLLSLMEAILSPSKRTVKLQAILIHRIASKPVEADLGFS
jgi:hypothetical protein